MLRQLLGLFLVPLILMLSGVRPGDWHCADGAPCESASALVCCCGCGESGSQLVHQCEDATSATLSEGPCGCYYAASAVDVRLPLSFDFHHALEPSPIVSAVVPPATVRVAFGAARSDGSPPRYLVSPADTRAPPSLA